MADRYGLFRTAQALPVEYYLLKRHVEQQGPASSGTWQNCPRIPNTRGTECDGFDKPLAYNDLRLGAAVRIV
jgi:hypothetical protein